MGLMLLAIIKLYCLKHLNSIILYYMNGNFLYIKKGDLNGD